MSYIDKEAIVSKLRSVSPELTIGLSDKQVYSYIVENYTPEELTGDSTAQFLSWDEPSPAQKRQQYEQNQLELLNKKENIAVKPKSWYQHITNANVAGWVGDATGWNFVNTLQCKKGLNRFSLCSSLRPIRIHIKR